MKSPSQPIQLWWRAYFREIFMSLVLSIVLAIALWVFPITAAATAAPMPEVFSAIPGLSAAFAGDTPELGLQNGQLLPCPDTPNCVVSQGADEAHAIEPIAYSRDRKTARDLLVKVIGVVPRSEIVTQTDDYIRVKSTSRIMGFVDDTEFYFPADAPIIHIRAAARLGQSDLGVNRRRLEQIRLALHDLGV